MIGLGMLEAIILKNGELSVLDQLELPHSTLYRQIESTEQAHDAIRRMVVRGAPAIAMVGVAGVAVDVGKYENDEDVLQYAKDQLDYVVTSRPTAVNLATACEAIKRDVLATSSAADVRENLLRAAEEMLTEDVATNKRIGQHGVEYVDREIGEEGQISVITICNTGSLATAGFGTALGIVRALHAANKLKHLYILETRPYNQGARLTAYEAVHDGLPATLITDSMASAILSQDKSVKLAVVGADRVAKNGDTANKIGTLQLAVVAKHFGVKFAVAAPTTSIDFNTPAGSQIKIEERAASELTDINGVRIAAPGIEVWNPAFDVTPFELIDAVVTENGLYLP